MASRRAARLAEPTFLIYGCYGYSGELICREAARRTLRPVLAGRNPARVETVAERYNFSSEVCDVDTLGAVLERNPDIKVVVNCAGPFTQTLDPVARACIAHGVHYVDITGEIPVFEAAAALHEEAKAADCCVMPGVGFDVIPTDCLALQLSQRLVTATDLHLAFRARGPAGTSHGTTKTMMEGVFGDPLDAMPADLVDGPRGPGYSLVRRQGRLRTVPLGTEAIDVPLRADRRIRCTTIPWGDVATAYRTTGIPNITTYAPSGEWGPTIMPWLSSAPVQWLLRTRCLRSLLTRMVLKEGGPDDTARARTRTNVWGRVEDRAGHQVEMRLECSDGYTFTALAAVKSAEYLLYSLPRRLPGSGARPRKGYLTPAQCFGEDFVVMADPSTVVELLREDGTWEVVMRGAADEGSASGSGKSG